MSDNQLMVLSTLEDILFSIKLIVKRFEEKVQQFCKIIFVFQFP